MSTTSKHLYRYSLTLFVSVLSICFTTILIWVNIGYVKFSKCTLIFVCANRFISSLFKYMYIFIMTRIWELRLLRWNWLFSTCITAIVIIDFVLIIIANVIVIVTILDISKIVSADGVKGKSCSNIMWVQLYTLVNKYSLQRLTLPYKVIVQTSECTIMPANFAVCEFM